MPQPPIRELITTLRTAKTIIGPDYKKRVGAAKQLGALRSTEAVQDLTTVIDENKNGDLCLAAIEALESARSVQDVGFDLGYSTSSAFIAMFARQAGCTPEQYRRQARVL